MADSEKDDGKPKRHERRDASLALPASMCSDGANFILLIFISLWGHHDPSVSGWRLSFLVCSFSL